MTLSQRPIVLCKDIVAVGIEGAEGGGTAGRSPLKHLRAGTEVTIVGDGFNTRTVKVRCNDCSYYAFLQDIEQPDSSYYLP
jgi:hypothetical protein